MRYRFLSALLITVIAVGSYWYVATAHVCPVPLSYRLGTLDDHFGLSAEEAKEYLTAAEATWETAANRDLFVYDEAANLTVNFLFDDRQALADRESAQSAALDERRMENEKLISTIESLQADYERLLETYNNSVAAYESRLQAYNQTVQRYNDQGGAPEGVYRELQAEQQALDTEAGSLQVRSDELNSLAERLNQLQNESNDRVAAYNRDVHRYNRQFGYEREFTQGDYTGKGITIYKFSSTAELVTVLTHEFGHALGIDHVEAEGSVMYYLLTNESETPVLSDDDIQALLEVCGSQDSWQDKLRRSIRNLLN